MSMFHTAVLYIQMTAYTNVLQDDKTHVKFV